MELHIGLFGVRNYGLINCKSEFSGEPILSQSSNAMRKGPGFCTTNCCRAVYVGKMAHLILKNLYRTENTLSGAWFCELLSDWSKTLFGSQDLVSVHKFKKSVLTHTPSLGQEEQKLIKNLLMLLHIHSDKN